MCIRDRYTSMRYVILTSCRGYVGFSRIYTLIKIIFFVAVYETKRI
jgi:hypothetical protein